MKPIAQFVLIGALALTSRSLAQSSFADFSSYASSQSTSQNQNIGFNAGAGLGGTFNVSFVNTGTWASTTASSPFFGVTFPPFIPIPGHPIGADLSTSFFTPFVTSNISPGTTSVEVLAFKGAAGSTTTITFDFTGLSTGYLPAGSKIAWVDTDYGETTTFTGVSGWYIGESLLFGDVTNGIQTGTSEADAASPFLTANTGNPAQLVLTGLASVTDSPGAIITTALNLTSLTVTVASPLNSADYFQAFAISAVPEPSTAVLCGLGIAFLAGARRRR